MVCATLIGLALFLFGITINNFTAFTNLTEKVDAQQLVIPGSKEEVEIRAATIYCSELIRKEIE